MKTISLRALEDHGACDVQLEVFRENFGNVAYFSSEEALIRNAVAVAEKLDWGWAARNLLPFQARMEYFNEAGASWMRYIETEPVGYLSVMKKSAFAKTMTEKATIFAKLWWKWGESHS